MDLLPISYEHYNILDMCDDDILYTYCEKVYRKEDYNSIEEMLQDISTIEFFPNITFHTLLDMYFEEQGKDIEDEIRGYAQHKSGFLMLHGGNYDWLSIDLFGEPGGLGVNKFEEWLKNKGYYLV